MQYSAFISLLFGRLPHVRPVSSLILHTPPYSTTLPPPHTLLHRLSPTQPPLPFPPQRVFSSRCESALASLGGGAILLDVCLRLPTIDLYSGRYTALVEGATTSTSDTAPAPFTFPANTADVTAFKTGSVPTCYPVTEGQYQPVVL